MITYLRPLNMTPGASLTTLTLSQYDSDFVLQFELFNSDGTFVIQSGTTAMVLGTKSDGSQFSDQATISGSTVTVTGDEVMTAIAGDNIYEIQLIHSNKVLASSNFILHIERAALDKDSLVIGTKVRKLVDITDRTDELIEAADSIENSASEIARLLANIENASSNVSQMIIVANRAYEELINELNQL